MYATVAILAFLGGSPAAEPPSDAARALEEAYAAYFGRAALDKGIVAVKDEDGGLKVDWDLQKAFDALEVKDAKLKIGAFGYRLTPADDGVWTLKSEALPDVEYDFPAGAGRMRGKFDYLNVAIDGRYDPSEPDFLTAKFVIGSIKGESWSTDPANANHSVVEQRDFKMDARAREDLSGGVDVSAAFAGGPLAQGVEAGAAKTTVKIATAGSAGGARFSALKANEISALWKYVVAHAGDKDGGAGAPPLIAAALPLWKDFAFEGAAKSLTVASPIGSAEIKQLYEKLGGSGVADDSRIGLAFKLDGAAVRSAALPPWAASLSPATLGLAVSVVDSGLGKAAGLALADPKFGSGDLSPETAKAAQKAILDGHPKLVIEPGRLTIPAIDLTFEGEISLEPGVKSAHARFTADQLDKAQAILTEIAANDPKAQQMILAFSLVKGLAKTVPDGRLLWDVDLKGDNVLINGAPMPTH